MSAAPEYSRRYANQNLRSVWSAPQEIAMNSDQPSSERTAAPISHRHLAALAALLREKGLIQGR